MNLHRTCLDSKIQNHKNIINIQISALQKEKQTICMYIQSTFTNDAQYCAFFSELENSDLFALS